MKLFSNETLKHSFQKVIALIDFPKFSKILPKFRDHCESCEFQLKLLNKRALSTEA